MGILNDNEFAIPVLWLGDDRHYDQVNRLFPDTYFSLNDFKFNPEKYITDFKIDTSSIFTLARGIPERKNKFNPFAKNNYELFVSELNVASHKLGDAPNPQKRFMGVFSQGTKALVNKKLL